MTIERMTDDDGQEWVSCDALCVGDYGGAGSVGEANIRALERDYPDAWVRHGDYYSRQLWLPLSEETEAIVQGLDKDYPLYDEEEQSRVEDEWEQEAWPSWLRSDLLRTLPNALRDWADELPDSDLFDAYRAAMECENEYPIPEYNGVAVRIDRIKGAFLERLTADALAEAVETCPELADAPRGILADCLADKGHDALAEAIREMAEGAAC